MLLSCLGSFQLLGLVSLRRAFSVMAAPRNATRSRMESIVPKQNKKQREAGICAAESGAPACREPNCPECVSMHRCDNDDDDEEHP